MNLVDVMVQFRFYILMLKYLLILYKRFKSYIFKVIEVKEKKQIPKYKICTL